MQQKYGTQDSSSSSVTSSSSNSSKEQAIVDIYPCIARIWNCVVTIYASMTTQLNKLTWTVIKSTGNSIFLHLFCIFTHFSASALSRNLRGLVSLPNLETRQCATLVSLKGSIKQHTLFVTLWMHLQTNADMRNVYASFYRHLKPLSNDFLSVPKIIYIFYTEIQWSSS
jgi:hypothetical protein